MSRHYRTRPAQIVQQLRMESRTSCQVTLGPGQVPVHVSLDGHDCGGVVAREADGRWICSYCRTDLTAVMPGRIR